MTEDLLHFIWKFRLLKPVSLCTTANLPLEIIRTGEHNTHAGPDFSNGRIRIGSTEWAGNIEVHWRSSEWNLHNHQVDKVYDNVILHVVHEHDKEVFNSKGQPIPCLELRHYMEPGVLEKYEKLYRNKREIPCGGLFSQCPDVTREPWLERMLIERLAEKTSFLKEVHAFTKGNWDETFYLLLCKNFGFKVNAEPFLQLGKLIPLNLLVKHADNPIQVEALLFGGAGLLEGEFTDDYPQRLKKEFVFLAHKYALPSPLQSHWKFMRMRPANFPTIRIAQMAAFVQAYQGTFSRILEAKNPQEVKELFRLSASPWWQNHYTFKASSIKKEKELGNTSIENILINTVCPLLFFYGKEREEEDLCQKALDWYSRLKTESNQVTKLYEALSFEPRHAGHSQALLQLHANYCKTKKCLRCAIGTYLLQNSHETTLA